MNLIPIPYYYKIYFTTLLFFVIGNIFLMSKKKINIALLKLSSIFLFVALIFFIGLRPISYIFGDMGAYAGSFLNMKYSDSFNSNSDIGFYQTMYILSKLVSVNIFFIILSILYILPLYISTKKLFPNLYYLAFLSLISSFSFFSYGTNGMRNGIATSLFIFALIQKKKIPKWLIFVISYSFHGSMILPIAAYLLTSLYNNYKFYIKLWILSIFISIIAGNFFEKLFLILGLNFSNKIEGYLTKKDIFADQFSNTGFRWDFLIYSAFPVLIGYYFLHKKKFEDKFYEQIYNIYLISNMVWILIIRASFSNRFAYLSWFLMGLVIIYPFLKKRYWKNQLRYTSLLIFIYFSFTYIMNIFVYHL